MSCWHVFLLYLHFFSEFPYCFVRSHESKLSKAISQAKPLFNNIDSPSRPQDTLPGAKNKYTRG